MWAAQVAVLSLGGLVGVHAFALAGLYGQGALEAARNAFVVAARHPGPTIAMLGLIGAAGSLTWMLGGAPWSSCPPRWPWRSSAAHSTSRWRRAAS